jgi:two-component system alkaline phosphatase synthesis response regulator PhoP
VLAIQVPCRVLPRLNQGSKSEAARCCEALVGRLVMKKPRILIVDDEPSFIRLLKLVLENTGRYAVREENDSVEALIAAKEFKPDLVLMDFVMPKVDGIGAAQAIRADAEFSRTPIVFLSATVVEQGGSTAQIAGFPAFSKPIGVAQLMHVIDETLAASRRCAGFAH